MTVVQPIERVQMAVLIGDHQRPQLFIVAIVTRCGISHEPGPAVSGGHPVYLTRLGILCRRSRPVSGWYVLHRSGRYWLRASSHSTRPGVPPPS